MRVCRSSPAAQARKASQGLRTAAINGKRGVTAETAILLSEALDTTPQFWMALQSDHDLWAALQRRRGGGSDSPVRAAPSAHRAASGRPR